MTAYLSILLLQWTRQTQDRTQLITQSTANTTETSPCFTIPYVTCIHLEPDTDMHIVHFKIFYIIFAVLLVGVISTSLDFFLSILLWKDGTHYVYWAPLKYTVTVQFMFRYILMVTLHLTLIITLTLCRVTKVRKWTRAILTLILILILTLTLSERNAFLWRPVNYNLAWKDFSTP